MPNNRPVTPFRRHEALLNPAWTHMRDQILLKNMRNNPETTEEEALNRIIHASGRFEGRWCKNRDDTGCFAYASPGSEYCASCKQHREDMGLLS